MLERRRQRPTAVQEQINRDRQTQRNERKEKEQKTQPNEALRV